jgi:DNA phosphorothioation-dependent restriction protein DptF
MNLINALGVLTKSSKYSVSTLRTESESDELQALKDYLYITPEIQEDFEWALEKASGNEIICLCGSSGDGKSEILTRLYKIFSRSVERLTVIANINQLSSAWTKNSTNLKIRWLARSLS